MDTETHISNWLMNYALENGLSGYTVGVSGGIDSAVTSTLCALTGLKVNVVTMPIHQAVDQHDRGTKHCIWLVNKYPSVEYIPAPLTKVYDEFVFNAPEIVTSSPLALANTKARLRMTTLYAIAQATNTLVAGTGNRVEDFGLGFFTKYGDGGVDVSPIGELTKTEVWQLGRELGINEDIINATPTDGLWDDNRGDEDQLGASYAELEWAMAFQQKWEFKNSEAFEELSNRELEVLDIYNKFHKNNAHKMALPPVCPHL